MVVVLTGFKPVNETTDTSRSTAATTTKKRQEESVGEGRPGAAPADVTTSSLCLEFKVLVNSSLWRKCHK